ncbi:unnamed protein product [Brassica napus]|uniref:(rape) hypothetical protein n=1 Tax=Brassica napus TaxID=3708 RepID=A0A816PMT3_BRANA|nr:unnamed protein product [Brassica napus]
MGGFKFFIKDAFGVSVFFSLELSSSSFLLVFNLALAFNHHVCYLKLVLKCFLVEGYVSGESFILSDFVVWSMFLLCKIP